MSVTHKQRMLAALKGEPTDGIPWVPRLDIWHNANKKIGALPERYRNASLRDIADDLDVGYHAIVPEFKQVRSPEDEVHRGLGIYNLAPMPYATFLDSALFSVEYRGDETIVEYRTPFGRVRTKVLFNEDMRRAGASISLVTEHAIKSPEDYAAVGYLFENARVEPNFAGYRERADYVGERGFAAAFLSLAGSPMHLLLRELMPPELFYLEIYNNPEALARCAEQIGGYFERVFATVVDCPAEVFLLGANYDRALTYPPFFRDHIAPWLRRFARMLHAKGKFLLTHTDGENVGLLDYYLESEIDIADSVCPRPMTSLTLKEVRDTFAGKITIMGGIPSVALLRNTMSDREFEAFLNQFFAELGAGDHLILGISDTTPPQAEFSRLLRIAERARAFGPVRPAKPVSEG